MSKIGAWLRPYSWEFFTTQNALLCRQCHRLAPFCFYNGNTFAGIIRDVIQGLGLPPDQSYVVRSLAGHIVAGVSTGEEERAFLEFCNSLET